MGIRTTDHRRPLWFGEGELKIYLDDDREWPTLVGTGTKTSWARHGASAHFDHLYQGAPLTEEKDGVWGFYRYHVLDPVYFAKAIRVTLQQIAGGSVAQLRALPASRRPHSSAVTSASFRRPRRLRRTRARGRTSSHRRTSAPRPTGTRPCASPRWTALEPYAERVKDLALPTAR